MNEQKIAVITDTGTDTPADFAAAHDVRTVALVINYSNGDSFRPGFEINSSEVIDRFAKEIPTTSLPSPSDIRSTLEPVRADGYESAVFVTISSGLSATNHTAHLVASQMPDFPVTIVDTKSVGIAAGLVVMGAVRMVEEGIPYEELSDRLEALAKETYGYFTVRELSYLHHGGRINEATYRLGSILNLKPVFTCDDEGKYVTVKKMPRLGEGPCFGALAYPRPRRALRTCYLRRVLHEGGTARRGAHAKDSGADTQLHRDRKD